MPGINDRQDNYTRRKFIRRLGLFCSGLAVGSLAFLDRRIFKPASYEIRALRARVKKLKQQGREGIPGRRWVMVIDLSKCNNSRKCIQACQVAHQLRPDQYHLNTLLMRDSPGAAPYYMPKHCQQCDNPACVSVCPVNATYKRSDGIVLIDNERCIGCRVCLAACPYSARIFNWFEPKDAEKYAQIPYDVELNVPQKRGTVSKCLFSADKIRKGELPYCVTACPNGVYWFGDENEDAVTNGTTRETPSLSRLRRDLSGYRLMEELGMNPRVYYLPPVKRIFPINEG